VHLDSIDQHIVACLVADARASFRAIGQTVGLSAPAVKRRVDRLRADGVITGFTAQVDPSVVGWNTQAFVAVTYAANVTPARIRTVLSRIPEVVAGYTVSGRADVLVHLRARDMEHFELALERLRGADAVARTESTIVLSTLLERPSAVETD
jgi:DNA-binding Lrp family transcriptional regulator